MSEDRENLPLPEAPEEPLPSDCCGGGCVPCVMDVYQEQLKQWLQLKAMSAGDRARWMQELREKEKGSSEKKTAAVSLSEYRTFTVKKCLGLRVGQHIIARVRESDGSYVSRPYTPISPLEQTGSFRVVIKVYEGGCMSKHVSQWREGSSVDWRGPFGSFSYEPNKYSHIGMLACGTGIAPMVQVIRAVVENEDEETFVHLVYGCRMQTDVLLKDELDQFASYWNFTVLYSLSRTSQSSLTSHPASIKYGDKVHVGRIDRQLVECEMPQLKAGRRIMILVCGTQSFCDDMVEYLTRIGYTSDMQFIY